MEDDWRRDWQVVADTVGTDFDTDPPVEGADRIESGLIRRFVEPLEFSCPLHFDAAVARKHGYRDVVAPLTSLITFSMPPIWRPGEPPVFTVAARDAQPDRSPVSGRKTGLEPECTGFFATDIAMDWLRPAYVGDRLHRRGATLVSCVPKETSVGRGAFMTWESDIRNQRDERVARVRTGTYSYVPNDADRAQPASPATRSRSDRPRLRESDVDWSRQRTWNEVAEGDRLPSLAFPISVYRLVVEAGANRDFNSIHHNSDYARATGAPEMYANTLFLQGMWERAVREYVGLAGRIRALSNFRMGRFNVAGDTVEVHGTVVRRWREDGVGHVAIEMLSENSSGVTVGPGLVTATLPDS
ncbi:MaoC family dehydratase N-terminal domain-containing protein [Pseudonocardia sp. N23]|uniref:FAS1-like dehydratase domain-containing protein n=1 Tax=Pseudonocardia sp. N23 TaxID=1987376 RepID=UPI000C0276FE|nr:MaoC family dehydratase N-terminal domain-containing protein [Pseudonocardia sp. N23]GAY11863.1 hypothetical protein TOK_0248 [Pseudonocardia sp. N23]